jgi:hypothetical protein
MRPEPAAVIGGLVSELSVAALRQQEHNLTTGAIAPEEEEADSEEQPLLAEDGNINGKAQDDYSKDWSEVPWYRRPSVSLTVCLECLECLD